MRPQYSKDGSGHFHRVKYSYYKPSEIILTHQGNCIEPQFCPLCVRPILDDLKAATAAAKIILDKAWETHAKNSDRRKK